jgi:hypothetical protein
LFEIALRETVAASPGLQLPLKYDVVRGDVRINTLEGFCSVFKRGMVGTDQHCKTGHRHRYLAEF